MRRRHFFRLSSKNRIASKSHQVLLCIYQGCGVGVGAGVGVGRSRLFFPESESESESTKCTDSDRLRASSYSRFTEIAMPII